MIEMLEFDRATSYHRVDFFLSLCQTFRIVYEPIKEE